MDIEFCDKKIQELYSKGYVTDLYEMSNKAIDDFFVALSMANSATNMDDLNFPPYRRRLQKDGSCTLFLRDGWKIKFFVKFSDEGNKIKVISFTNNERERGCL